MAYTVKFLWNGYLRQRVDYPDLTDAMREDIRRWLAGDEDVPGGDRSVEVRAN